MQPLQCVSQHQVASPPLPTHKATQQGNTHAAIPRRSATQDSKSPYNCNAQTRTEHLEATPTVRNQSHVKTIVPATAAHPRYLSSPAKATLHGKTQGFVPNYLPKRSSCNIHAAITMHFATSRPQPASLYAHGNTTWQQSCSHSTAICNPRFQITLEHFLHTNKPGLLLTVA